jgi:hypothetical protein
MEVIIFPITLSVLCAAGMAAVFRGKVTWKRPEFLFTILAPLEWVALNFILRHPWKSLSNFFIENLALILLPIGYVFYRRFIFRGIPTGRIYIVTTFAFVALTLGEYLVVPGLPE